MKITGEADAWLPDHSLSVRLSDVKMVLDAIQFPRHDMSSCNWIKIGRATVTIDLCIDENGLNAAKVKVLQEQLRDMSAKFEAGKTEILRRISQLQAIDYTPEVQHAD